jgi:crotonobetainyl-CoA:carnitine CoA-transferase CaiB-like acyl-CoA transferase
MRRKARGLDHLNVLDCSYGSIAGCFASSILGELGAEVIRIKPRKATRTDLLPLA